MLKLLRASVELLSFGPPCKGRASRDYLTAPWHLLSLDVARDSFFAFHNGKTGYSGVATFCRRSVTVPVLAEEGFTGILAAQQGEQLQHKVS
jgi:AP endonuclease-2